MSNLRSIFFQMGLFQPPPTSSGLELSPPTVTNYEGVRLRIPCKEQKMFHAILVVTSQHTGKGGRKPKVFPLLAVEFSRVDFSTAGRCFLFTTFFGL